MPTPHAVRQTVVSQIELAAIPLDAAPEESPESPEAPVAVVPARPVVPPDAAPLPTKILVSPAKDAEYAVGTGPRKPVPDDGIIRLDLLAEAEVHVYSVSRCCQEDSKVVRPGDDVTIVMPYLPGRVLPICRDNPLAEVRIAGVSANLGETFSVPIGQSTDETKTVAVEFLGDRVDPTPIKVTVAAGKTKEVKCVVAPR